MTGPVSYPSERRLVALACRLLAMEGLAETTLGHVSLRVDDTHCLVRGRRASEHGLLFTTADDIVLVDLGGNLHPGEPPVSLPSELLKAMGEGPVCLLRGHGLAAAGQSLARAVLAAIDVDALARLTVTCLQMQRPLTEIDPSDYRDLPVFGQAYYDLVRR